MMEECSPRIPTLESVVSIHLLSRQQLVLRAHVWSATKYPKIWSLQNKQRSSDIERPTHDSFSSLRNSDWSIGCVQGILWRISHITTPIIDEAVVVINYSNTKDYTLLPYCHCTIVPYYHSAFSDVNSPLNYPNSALCTKTGLVLLNFYV